MLKTKRILLSIFYFVLFSIQSSALSHEVQLVVSAKGNTEQDAINNALRLAVEEAYGVFVSASTEIINDSVVKDEIVTISSGNILSFNVISSILLPNGTCDVTLLTTVSIAALKNYAINHGAECVFNGEIFGANVKLFEINKRNSELAIRHLVDEVSLMSSKIYNYTLSISEPKMNGNVDFSIGICTNDNYKTLVEHIDKVICGISINELEVNKLISQEAKIYKYNSQIKMDDRNTNIIWTKYLYSKIPNELIEYLSPRTEIDVLDNLQNVYKIPINYSKRNNFQFAQKLSEGIICMWDDKWSRLVYSETKTINIPISTLGKISSFYIKKDVMSYKTTTEESLRQKAEVDMLFRELINKLDAN